jgi:hypothetical protein
MYHALTDDHGKGGAFGIPDFLLQSQAIGKENLMCADIEQYLSQIVHPTQKRGKERI